jgi:Holliday junction DNA helicase RuvA
MVGQMRVLGVDPGLTRCGFGVIEGVPGRALTMVATGVAVTRADDSIGLRLLALEEQIEGWLTDYRPEAVAVERVFSQHNVRTVMGTAQAGAVAIVCSARRGLPVALHTPSEVKAAAALAGRPPAARRLGGRAGPGHLPPVARIGPAPARRRGVSGVGGFRGGGRESKIGNGRDAMIAHLDGTVASVAPDGAVIDVGGVGLLVQCTPGTLARLRPGERTRVATSLIVREDALTLYGFVGDDERNTFELLQTASGVGPRLALAMLAVFNPDALRRAVAAEDLAALTTVPGIGRKGAQRIVLELAGRLGSPGDLPVPAPFGGGPAGTRAAPWREQVRAGLVSLGWQARDADQAIAAVEPELLASAAANGAAANGAAANGAAANGAAANGAAADAPPADGQVDVSVALRAALRVLGRT